MFRSVQPSDQPKGSSYDSHGGWFCRNACFPSLSNMHILGVRNPTFWNFQFSALGPRVTPMMFLKSFCPEMFPKDSQMHIQGNAETPPFGVSCQRFLSLRLWKLYRYLGALVWCSCLSWRRWVLPLGWSCSPVGGVWGLFTTCLCVCLVRMLVFAERGSILKKCCQ